MGKVITFTNGDDKWLIVRNHELKELEITALKYLINSFEGSDFTKTKEKKAKRWTFGDNLSLKVKKHLSDEEIQSELKNHHSISAIKQRRRQIKLGLK